MGRLLLKQAAAPLFGALILLLSSCANLPPDEDVKAFGDAASSSMSAMQNALNTNRLLAVKISQEREGLAYLTGAPGYQLRLSDADAGLVLTAAKQIEVLGALNGYASALVEAADKGVTTELTDAANKLGASVGALAGAVSPETAPITTPAIKLGANLVGLGLKHRYATEIRDVIRQADPAVQQLVGELPASLEGIALLTQVQVENYEVKRLEVLDALRRDRRVDHLARYKEYLIARADVDNVVTLQKALKSSASIFAKLGAAHKALAEGANDRSAQVQEFAAVASDLAALLKAINATRAG